jgi:hypothetical protein
MLLLSAPVGTFVGLITWAALRGRGGLSGLVLFGIFGMLTAFVGALAADAVVRSASEGAIALGATCGAGLASAVGTLGFGGRLLASRSVV